MSEIDQALRGNIHGFEYQGTHYDQAKKPTPTEYVCGFLFNDRGDYVVLIKRRDTRSYMPGRWNGVGGHVETSEAPLQAMQREFKEEAGLEVRDWKKFGTLTTDYGESLIHFFRAEQSTDEIYKVTTETDELVRPVALTSLAKLPLMPNLLWIISMAQSVKNCGVDMYHVVEEGRRGF